MYCMGNVITQFNNNFYSQVNGIITGGNDSVSIANIAMRYIMLTAQEVLQSCELVRRFIDDMILLYIGSLQSAEDMEKCLIEKFKKEGITFRHIQTHSLKEYGKGGGIS